MILEFINSDEEEENDDEEKYNYKVEYIETEYKDPTEEELEEMRKSLLIPIIKNIKKLCFINEKIKYEDLLKNVRKLVKNLILNLLYQVNRITFHDLLDIIYGDKLNEYVEI